MPWYRTARNVPPQAQVRRRQLLHLPQVLSIVWSTLLRINSTCCQDGWTRTCAPETSRSRSVVPTNARTHGGTMQLPKHCAQVTQSILPLPLTSKCTSQSIRPLTSQVPKINGIQVTYGKQDPTHNWNRYTKRSFKRACHRAIVHGQAPYKGRLLTVVNPNDSCSQPRVINHKAPTHTPPRQLQVYCFNVGGLGSGMYEDLMGFLDQSHFDVALLQENKAQR